MALKVNGKGRNVYSRKSTKIGKSLVFEPKLLPLCPCQLPEKKPHWRRTAQSTGPPPLSLLSMALVPIHGTVAFLGMMSLKTLGP